MATRNGSLPGPMKDRVGWQARRGRSGNAGDDGRDRVRRDRERAARIADMQAAVTEGLASGVGARSMDELRNAARRLAGEPPR